MTMPLASIRGYTASFSGLCLVALISSRLLVMFGEPLTALVEYILKGGGWSSAHLIRTPQANLLISLLN